MLPSLSEQGLLAVQNGNIIVGYFNFSMALILFFCRDLEIASAKKLLTGAGVGFLCIFALTLRDGIFMAEELGPMATPIPAIIIWAFLSVWLLYVWTKKGFH